ncbi:hypothetical protein GOY07_03440 [Wolbachia endosymbiont of Litomosoides sigmodontis]|uniref:hypothetical protein n=1 Tax=Wolbachia endosymbiont of Litomosoides sigmodontis TaxID=80850 RepID=UPI00158BC64F|nr:hypothetical protein [Wolbachia endosymbiont of Litomosoides sigmodontis]QKX03204.1 hypothetical protein GOY07_03440 [Wolbachia endosymbiont of Litomosoides sigmodontis]
MIITKVADTRIRKFFTDRMTEVICVRHRITMTDFLNYYRSPHIFALNIADPTSNTNSHY